MSRDLEIVSELNIPRRTLLTMGLVSLLVKEYVSIIRTLGSR